MRRPFSLVVLVSLVLSACAPASSGDVSTSMSDAPTTSATATTDGGSDTTTPGSTTSPPGTTSDRPLAPDFTLALGDGGSYTLSEGSKPVYLVFWAEW